MGNLSCYIYTVILACRAFGISRTINNHDINKPTTKQDKLLHNRTRCHLNSHPDINNVKNNQLPTTLLPKPNVLLSNLALTKLQKNFEEEIWKICLKDPYKLRKRVTTQIISKGCCSTPPQHRATEHLRLFLLTACAAFPLHGVDEEMVPPHGSTVMPHTVVLTHPESLEGRFLYRDTPSGTRA